MESKGLAAAYRRKLAERLREEQDEIAREIAGRIRALRGKGSLPEGLEEAVRAALTQAFRAIEGKKDRHAPLEVIAYSRKLAEEGFETSALMRRCYQCLAVFREHLRRADASIKGRSQDGYATADKAIDHLFERLQEAVEEAHREENEHRNTPGATRQLEEVRQVLAGELNYLPEGLGYDSSATHIGVVGSGLGVEGEIRRLAKMLGGQLLIVQASPNQFWAWIGLKLESSADRLEDALKTTWADAVRMAIGKPAAGISGWRRTHRQAKVVLPIAIRGDNPVVRYADAALLAAMAGDDLLQDLLRENYLMPLASTRDGGETLKATLRAYFARHRQVSSAAEVLGVKRHTVRKHLDNVERLLGCTLDSCAAELDLALRLDVLSPSSRGECPGRR